MSKQTRLRTQELRRVEQAAAAKRVRRRRIITTLGALVIAGLVVAIAVVIVQAASNHRSLPEVTGEVVVPQHLTTSGAIPVGKASAPVSVEVYYDYMCPACGAFEAANSSELDRLVADGTARVELHPIAFLDRLSSGTQYSTRSANAIAVVADAAPDSVWDFHTALYQHQPAEGSEGLTDQQIADIASAAGVPAAVVARFADGTYQPWVASTTREAFASGVEHTPTIKINGKVFDGDAFTVGPLTQAIESAAADQ
jgi:protein-disulfide isomerase